MPPLVDLTSRPPALEVEVRAAPAYEFVLSLLVFAGHGSGEPYEAGAEWFERVRGMASKSLLRLVERYARDRYRFWARGLLGVAYDTPPPADVGAFLAHLARLPAADVRLRLLGYYARGIHDVPREVVARAARGDAAAAGRFLDAAFPGDPDARALYAGLLSGGAAEAKADLLRLLRGWHERVFRRLDPEVMPLITRDAEARQQLAATVSPLRLIEIATGGIEYVPDAGIRRAVLVPSHVLRPFNLVADHGDVLLLCYPLAPESADPAAPPAHLVALYKALADDTRLRVLKTLASGGRTLQQLADHLGLAKSTMHHHMVFLRRAGLVRLRLEGTDGGEKVYHLRRDALADAPALLESFLR